MGHQIQPNNSPNDNKDHTDWWDQHDSAHFGNEIGSGLHNFNSNSYLIIIANNDACKDNEHSSECVEDVGMVIGLIFLFSDWKSVDFFLSGERHVVHVVS